MSRNECVAELSSVSRVLRFLIAAWPAILIPGCDDTNGSCLAACHHIVACVLDAGYSAGGPADLQCQEFCAGAADAGYGGCKSPAATYDCIAGLQCTDVISSVITDTGLPPSDAYVACVQKAQCDGTAGSTSGGGTGGSTSGGGTGGTTGGSCPTALCGGVCCEAGTSCLTGDMCCASVCNGFCCSVAERDCVNGCCAPANVCGGNCCTSTQQCDAGTCT